MNRIELDAKELLGFRLLADDGPGMSVLTAKPGVKSVAKPGSPMSAKMGVKVGVKGDV